VRRRGRQDFNIIARIRPHLEQGRPRAKWVADYRRQPVSGWRGIVERHVCSPGFGKQE
jgi:hypothetical protein